MPVTKHLKITGKVQGVYYRASLSSEAQRLGITGWVRNRADGSVEAMIQGEAKIVDELIAWAWRGPQYAEVREIESATISDAEIFSTFEKRSTT